MKRNPIRIQINITVHALDIHLVRVPRKPVILCVISHGILNNEEEIPLLKKVKPLQDGINTMLSDFENNMQEDSRNTILVLTSGSGSPKAGHPLRHIPWHSQSVPP